MDRRLGQVAPLVLILAGLARPVRIRDEALQAVQVVEPVLQDGIEAANLPARPDLGQLRAERSIQIRGRDELVGGVRVSSVHGGGRTT